MEGGEGVGGGKDAVRFPENGIPADGAGVERGVVECPPLPATSYTEMGVAASALLLRVCSTGPGWRGGRWREGWAE